jgi:hypothetical protein
LASPVFDVVSTALAGLDNPAIESVTSQMARKGSSGLGFTDLSELFFQRWFCIEEYLS